MTIDLTKTQFTTTANMFKNEPSTSGSINVAASSIAPSAYNTYSTNIPLSRTNGTTQVFQNFSFDSGKYYVGPWVQVQFGTYFTAQTRMYQTGSNLHIDLYVINTGSPTAVTVPAFTLSIQVRRFLTPFV